MAELCIIETRLTRLGTVWWILLTVDGAEQEPLGPFYTEREGIRAHDDFKSMIARGRAGTSGRA